MCKGIAEETTFLGGVIVVSTVSTDGDELDVEQPNLEWTSLSTSDPFVPCSFVDTRGPSQQLHATSAFDSGLWQRLNCVSDLPTKSFALYLS